MIMVMMVVVNGGDQLMEVDDSSDSKTFSPNNGCCSSRDQITGLIMTVVAITRALTPTLSTLQVIQGASNVQALALFDPLPSLALSATGPI